MLARCRDACGEERALDCAPFVAQGKRDDKHGRRATRQRKEPAGCRRYNGNGDGVSASNIPAVVRYIRNQESHHRKMNFETEFLALLKKHNVEFDPKFVFG
jgi:hypothetical protein